MYIHTDYTFTCPVPSGSLQNDNRLLFSSWSQSPSIPLFSSFRQFVAILYLTHVWSQLWLLSRPLHYPSLTHERSILFFPNFPTTVTLFSRHRITSQLSFSSRNSSYLSTWRWFLNFTFQMFFQCLYLCNSWALMLCNNKG